MVCQDEWDDVYRYVVLLQNDDDAVQDVIRYDAIQDVLDVLDDDVQYDVNVGINDDDLLDA